VLAEAHNPAGEDDEGRLGVFLADLVLLELVAAPAEVCLAAVHRAGQAVPCATSAGARACTLLLARGRHHRGRRRDLRWNDRATPRRRLLHRVVA
jgi:hypothetical protein